MFKKLNLKHSLKIENLKLKIIFFGTPDFVEPVLKKLEENFEVVRSVRKPQQWNNLPAEAFSPAKASATAGAKAGGTIEQLNSLNPDFFVVAAYGQILPPNLLAIPKYGAINIHPSLLPKYRGPSPIQTAILNGDKKTGVTFFKMDEEIDHGLIIEQFEEEIKPDDTFESLAVKLFERAATVLVPLLSRHDKWKPQPQDESKATYTKLLTRNDGYIDLSSLEIRNLKFEIARRIRAHHPWPGVWTRYALISPTAPKSLIKLLPEDRIQVEGRRPMSYKDFINGYTNGEKFLRAINLIPN